MKTTIKILVFLLLLGTECLDACKKDKNSLTFEGTVYDTIGGAPAASVTIELRACNAHDERDQCNNSKIGEATTDANGHFIIEATAARSDRYFVRCGSRIYGGSLDLSKSDLESAKYKTLYSRY